MNGLLKRVLSAVAATALLIVVFYYFKREGLFVVGGVVFAIGAYEFSKMVFTKPEHKFLPALFLIYAFVLLLATLIAPPILLALWGVALASFITNSLWILRNKLPIDQLLSTLAIAVLGLIYCSLFPAFALRLLYLEDGMAWFMLLVTVVFSGDTFAYFGGITFGKTKLMPHLSPGKTVAGAVAGTIGSGIAGALMGHFYLSHHSQAGLIVCSVLASNLAQNGDLFESLVKRVANVKDSGKIMPGHGGILDRLDGIYFAAPLIYAFAEYLYR